MELIAIIIWLIILMSFLWFKPSKFLKRDIDLDSIDWKVIDFKNYFDDEMIQIIVNWYSDELKPSITSTAVDWIIKREIYLKDDLYFYNEKGKDLLLVLLFENLSIDRITKNNLLKFFSYINNNNDILNFSLENEWERFYYKIKNK